MEPNCLLLANTVGFSQLKMFKRSSETKWKLCSEQIDENSVFKLDRAAVICDPQESETLLKKSVYGVLALAIGSDDVEGTVLYYLINIPHQTKLDICYVRKHYKATDTINKRFNASTILNNWQSNIYISEPNQSLRKQTKMIPLLSLCKNYIKGVWCELFVSQDPIDIIGVGEFTERNSSIREYDRLVSGEILELCESRRAKAKKRVAQDTGGHKININRKINRVPNSGTSFVVPKLVGVHLCSHDKLLQKPKTLSLKRKFINGTEVPINNDNTIKKRPPGIFSDDSGGRNAVIPLICGGFTGTDLPVVLSEMHIVTTVPDVFKIKHSPTTIKNAIDEFQLECMDKYFLSEKEFERILGAVSSKFFEDISFQIVEDPPSEHIFKSLKLDVDQVFKQLNIYMDVGCLNFKFIRQRSLCNLLIFTKFTNWT
jgi:hypothetical protein